MMKFFTRRQKPDTAVLQESFHRRYRAFRSLLTANNNALELMAGMEDTLARGRPYGMSYVRGTCTALGVNVFRMVQSLAEVSDGRYPALAVAFERISGQMEAVLDRHPDSGDGDFVLPLAALGRGDAGRAGDKMSNLGEVLNHAGLPVPDGFVITAAATRRFMEASGIQDEINRLLRTLDIDDLEQLYTVSARIQSLIGRAPVPDDLAEAIMHGYEALAGRAGGKVLVSMRSSAVEEDRGGVSFAGQYRTQLNVSEDLILQTYKEIVAGKYMSQAIVYRHQRGFRHQDVVMCVGCLTMVDAAVSGVIFTRPPGKPEGEWMEVSAAPGLASGVVEGSEGAVQLRVGRDEPRTVIREAEAGLAPGAARVSGAPGADAAQKILTDRQIRELAAAALRLEEHFGSPQDIEWSVDRKGILAILQSRPMVAGAPQPQGGEVIDAAGKARTSAEPAAAGEVLLEGGVTASGGVAAGPVFIVRSSVDLLEFPAGAILAVEQPLPQWSTLLKRAAGIISPQGHAAVHLAIVAREFGAPALFGLPHVFDILHNNDIITLDAGSCRIYRGVNQELLDQSREGVDLMANSPVEELFREVLSLVVPLNLTDPDSPFFRPSQCRTLHDITRFCHERAVADMFSFGEKARFDARAAKQLVGRAPYQWWIIDLDDGFAPDYDTSQKYVSMDDIASEPMRAIWEGMTAKPWQGPPPIDLKGFGSVLFRSTMNPSLDPAVGSKLGGRNYFLISRNFCNLSMRLGYHFSLVEAYLGPHLTENYVSFQFRGGAADRGRRFMRVNLLRDILERYGFRVDVRQDALTARMEKLPAEELLEGLRLLGYLLIHTRQIDMVMGEAAMVERYRQRIIADIDGMAGNWHSPPGEARA